jgi:S1-C subfamily serine protease
MLERVVPSVVSILVEGATAKPIVIGAGGVPKEEEPKEPFRAGGSGVIIDAEKGIIITNNHVIANASNIGISLSDGRTTEAKLLGTDVATDVAVLQIPLKDLTALPLGNSDKLRVGDFVVAVGNPFGLEGTATQGIVSALMRTNIGYEIFENFIQIDAAVNPGNSGGALVDIDGNLVGINTATGAAKLRTQGISFAIPINMARAIAGELESHGTFKHGSLGIIAEDLNFMMASRMGLNITRGAAVEVVVPGSPADLAGIKPGEVIISIDGKTVRSHADSAALVWTSPIGTELTLELVSRNARRKVNVKVADIVVPPTPVAAPASAPSLEGAQLADLLPGFKAFGLIQGVRVLSPGAGLAAASGLHADDVITKVDMSTVRIPDDVFDAVSSKMGRYRLEVYRDGKTFWIWVGAPS